MTHLDEHTIDILLLNPALLDEGTRMSSQRHLLTCTGCRAVSDSLAAFYGTLERGGMETGELTAHQDAILRSLMPVVPVIRLAPFAPRPSAYPRHFQDGISVLAAKGSPVKQTTRFETVATLASSEHGLLARIVLDSEPRRFKVYLLADDASQREAVLLNIPRLSLNLLLDDKGQQEFTLLHEISPGEWSHLEAIARLPIGYEVVMTAGMRSSGTCSLPVKGLGGSYAVSFRYEAEHLMIDVATKTLHPPGTAVIFSPAAADPLLVELEHGKGQVALPVLPAAFTIRLYS